MTLPANDRTVWISFALVGALAVVSTTTPAPASEGPQQAFFDTLTDLCGSRFVGEMTFPTDDAHELAGRELEAEIARCEDDRIEIPFRVGEDRSRTWILTRTGKTLQLKHDHRHADGTPEEITMYGGTARESGTPFAQAFPADAQTATLIPEAATNVWNLFLSEDRSTLTYHLERHGRPRFTAVLRRAGEAPAGSVVYVPKGWEGAWDFGYAPVIRVGDQVIVSGVPAGGPGTYEEKIERMYRRIGELLAIAGADFADIVELTSFHVESKDSAAFGAEFDRYMPIHRKFFGEHRPAWSAVGVTTLLSPSAVVEVRVVAVVGSGEGSRVEREDPPASTDG